MAQKLNIEEPAGTPAEQRRTVRLVNALAAAVGSVPTAGAELAGYEVSDGTLTHNAAVDGTCSNLRFWFWWRWSRSFPRDAREQIARWAGQRDARVAGPAARVHRRGPHLRRREAPLGR